MKKPILSRFEVAHLAYQEAKKVSDDLLTKARFFYQEKISDDKVSRLGHNRRFVTRVRDSSLALSTAFLTLATTIINNIQQDTQRSFAATAKKLSALFTGNEALNITHDFTINSKYLHTDEVQAIDLQLAHDLATVDRIAEGKFIGPHPEEMHKLVGAFSGAQLDKEEFTRQALSLRGIIFSNEHNAHALSADKIDNIRAQFNHIGATPEPLKLVLVYREQVQDQALEHKPSAKIVVARPDELQANYH